MFYLQVASLVVFLAIFCLNSCVVGESRHCFTVAELTWARSWIWHGDLMSLENTTLELEINLLLPLLAFDDFAVWRSAGWQPLCNIFPLYSTSCSALKRKKPILDACLAIRCFLMFHRHQEFCWNSIWKVLLWLLAFYIIPLPNNSRAIHLI